MNEHTLLPNNVTKSSDYVIYMLGVHMNDHTLFPNVMKSSNYINGKKVVDTLAN